MCDLYTHSTSSLPKYSWEIVHLVGFYYNSTPTWCPLFPFPSRNLNSPPPPCIFSSRLDCYASIWFDPCTVQLVASHYTDWATRPTLIAIQVYNLTIYCYLICVLFWMCGCVCPVILCVTDPKMCIFTDNICNQEEFCVFFSSPDRQNMKHCVYAVGGKRI
jgi:hypothetical protein